MSKMCRRGCKKISPKVTLYTDILNYGQFSQSGLHIEESQSFEF